MYIALFWGKVRPKWQGEPYNNIGARMYERASQMPGFIALHQLNVPDGRELAIAYFDTEEHMIDWYNDPEHRAVETLARREILDDYTIEILELTRSYTKESSTFSATTVEQQAADKLHQTVIS